LIFRAGKNVGAAEVARAASQTRHSKRGLEQGRLQMHTGFAFKFEYLDFV